MKRIVGGIIDFFAYKHPEIWHRIKDDLFLIIDLEQKEQVKKMKERVGRLYDKLMKK